SIPNGTLYNFGVLMSEMHMSWVKYTCGRLKSDFRYSKNLVYNNYPWPKNPSGKHKQIVEEKAQKVLDVRDEFPESSLADLYDPLTMPPKLVKAHQELDKAVDLCYRPKSFQTENARIGFLFDLYNEYVMALAKKH
ncbi:MAG: class I SAM-dependent DNA methyltransferase, partial [Chlorobi bacterium]|nr:class I SAM-dependent DNA methyltransferase [Chlorobiota bacterium]